MLPAAPGLFSMKKFPFSSSASNGCNNRAITSTGPPGPNGTTIFTGRSGHAAKACVTKKGVALAKAAELWRKRRRLRAGLFIFIGQFFLTDRCENLSVFSRNRDVRIGRRSRLYV